MELYDKLSNVFPADHLSISTTQTIIEETDPGAATSEAIIEHTGTEVLKISKDLLVEERDSVPNYYCPLNIDYIAHVCAQRKFGLSLA